MCDHGTGAVTRVDLDGAHGALGHGGGDLGVLRAFATSLDPSSTPAGEHDGLTSDGRTSLESHLVGWAAEEARLQGTVVDVTEFRSRHGL